MCFCLLDFTLTVIAFLHEFDAYLTKLLLLKFYRVCYHNLGETIVLTHAVPLHVCFDRGTTLSGAQRAGKI